MEGLGADDEERAADESSHKEALALKEEMKRNIEEKHNGELRSCDSYVENHVACDKTEGGCIGGMLGWKDCATSPLPMCEHCGYTRRYPAAIAVHQYTTDGRECKGEKTAQRQALSRPLVVCDTPGCCRGSWLLTRRQRDANQPLNWPRNSSDGKSERHSKWRNRRCSNPRQEGTSGRTPAEGDDSLQIL